MFRLLCAAALTGGCTAFSTVRPATVSPGPSLIVQGSIAQPPGDQAAWFYAFDCANYCSRAITSTDVVFTVGNVPSDPQRGPVAIGIGVNGLTPYIEGYWQLSRSATPYGIGLRLGTFGRWWEHQLYLRFERAIDRETKLLWNPGVLLRSGNSPNGENPGRLLALVNGFGVELGSGPVAFTPSASVVLSRAGHTSYGVQYGPETRLFATGALSVTFRRDPAPD
jgi:hypothetical protein